MITEWFELISHWAVCEMMMWLEIISPCKSTRCAVESNDDLIDFAAELQTWQESAEITVTWDQTERTLQSIDLIPDVSFTFTFSPLADHFIQNSLQVSLPVCEVSQCTLLTDGQVSLLI